MRHPWLFNSPEGNRQTICLIGWRCKHGNVFSLPILISREAWPYYRFNPETDCLSFELTLKSIDSFPGDHREVAPTRSHPEHDRETPLRRWYCGFVRGRVGRRQVFFCLFSLRFFSFFRLPGAKRKIRHYPKHRICFIFHLLNLLIMFLRSEFTAFHAVWSTWKVEELL